MDNGEMGEMMWSMVGSVFRLAGFDSFGRVLALALVAVVVYQMVSRAGIGLARRRMVAELRHDGTPEQWMEPTPAQSRQPRGWWGYDGADSDRQDFQQWLDRGGRLVAGRVPWPPLRQMGPTPMQEWLTAQNLHPATMDVFSHQTRVLALRHRAIDPLWPDDRARNTELWSEFETSALAGFCRDKLITAVPFHREVAAEARTMFENLQGGHRWMDPEEMAERIEALRVTCWRLGFATRAPELPEASDPAARAACLARIEWVHDDLARRRLDLFEVIEHNALFQLRFEPTRAFEEFDLRVRDTELTGLTDAELRTMATELETRYAAAVQHAEAVGVEALDQPGLGVQAMKLARTAADTASSAGERANARTKLEKTMRTLGLPVEPRALDALHPMALEAG